MKERQVPITDYKIKYFSEDECFSSFNKAEVEQYEAKLNGQTSEPKFISEIRIWSGYDGYWDLYNCETEEAFMKLLSNLLASGFVRHKEGELHRLCKEYSPDCKYYGTQTIDCGDHGDEIRVERITGLYEWLMNNITCLEEEIENLGKSKEYLNELLTTEPRDE